MNNNNFDNVIVQKPWGYEYLLYQNDTVALWYLYIKKGQETSLHSHPKKKTGLIVLSGGAEISFLSTKFKMFPSDKIMIRHGVFHKTQAITDDVELLEIETPVNKEDVVRLKDKYGRAGTPYENQSHYTIVKEPKFYSINDGPNIIGDCNLILTKVNTPKEIIQLKVSKFVILEGNISFNQHLVVEPGDILDQKNFSLMMDNFTMNPMLILGIKKND